MQSEPGEGVRASLFAVVSYIPDPLGSWIDNVRQELVPGCSLRAHVTILPPRLLCQRTDAALELIRKGLRGVAPFDLRVGEVEVFSISSVVFLGVTEGFQELCRLHERLNTDGLVCREAYPYHPHITLAQQLAPEQMAGVYEFARRRWAEYRGARSFAVDRVTFVRGETLDHWIDLAECPIGRGQ